MNQEELASEVEQELATPLDAPVAMPEESLSSAVSPEVASEEDIPEWLRGVSAPEMMTNSESEEGKNTSSDMPASMIPEVDTQTEEMTSDTVPGSFEIEEVGVEPKKRPAKKPMKKPMKKPEDKARLTPDVPVNPSDGDLPEWLK
jgi:hypothetical protein